MKLRMILAAALMMAVPLFVDAQGKGKGQGKNKGHKAAKHQGKAHKQQVKQSSKGRYYSGHKAKGGPPPWAPAHGYRAKQHVYFPDYYTFYDPHRGGYTYWNNNGWAFTRSVPTFLGGVDLGKARLQVLSDAPLATPPETYYSRYSTMYPARAVNINVNAPRP